MSNLIFTAVLSAAIRMSSSLKEAETARREAERERTEAELSNLRNQLNPHFLLNTLNNIYALTAFDTEKAQQAIQELKRLLAAICSTIISKILFHYRKKSTSSKTI